MRVARGTKARRRRNKVLKRASGFRGGNSRVYSVAAEKSDRALAYAYRDRKVKKREFRKLWTQRINAGARLCGTTYSRLMGAINKSEMEIDRKILADLAVNDMQAFKAIVDKLNA
ncbi:MAG: 50S ribosomal protein L20 [Bdellovibrionaceae bacterium]|nr:50S ribosomal protein L20 [Pseudobdellovibrionaceae bacterium]|tara:strand:- start:41 stop:385 length:345 start_codon:yes stop_codon:yes gene_type:complete